MVLKRTVFWGFFFWFFIFFWFFSKSFVFKRGAAFSSFFYSFFSSSSLFSSLLLPLWWSPYQFHNVKLLGVFFLLWLLFLLLCLFSLLSDASKPWNADLGGAPQELAADCRPGGLHRTGPRPGRGGSPSYIDFSCTPRYMYSIRGHSSTGHSGWRGVVPPHGTANIYMIPTLPGSPPPMPEEYKSYVLWFRHRRAAACWSEVPLPRRGPHTLIHCGIPHRSPKE